jgi:phosphoribosylamine-glycine ligase
MKLEKDTNLIAAVVGKDGRTSAIRRCLAASSRISGPVAVLSEGRPPGGVIDEVLREADKVKPDFVVVGPEEPLALGVVDALEQRGIACVGPNQALARIEASKAFTRQLLTEHRIPGNPEHTIFERIGGVADYLRTLGEFVVKPDGLTGGKGVKVRGTICTRLTRASSTVRSFSACPGRESSSKRSWTGRSSACRRLRTAHT